MIRFECECGKLLQARDENSGKLAICPVCKRQLTVPAEAPPLENIQKERPVLRDERELDEEEAIQERPRRHHRQPAGSSGKAVASLILGILSLFCSVLAAVPALILGVLAMREIARSQGRLSGHGLALGGIVTACVCTLLSCAVIIPISLLLPAVQKVRDAAGRAESSNNLKQMTLAMLNYNDTYGTLPPAAIGDPTKPERQRRPLLSWRVAILPFIEQQNLYNQFKFDEPWDGPNNIRLLPRMPKTFMLPGASQTPSDHTHYQVFVGNGAAFDKQRGHKLPMDFRDGLANTILITVAEKAVPWTKPDDINFDPARPIVPLLSSHFPSGFNVGLADASVQMIPRQISEATLKAAITRQGGERLGPDWPGR